VTTAIPALAASVAGFGLPPADPRPPAVLDDVTFELLLACATRERITGHLEQSIRCGRLLASDEQYERALLRHEQVLGVDLVLERLLADTSALLTEASIPHRALKGPALAHLAFTDPSLRSFGDIDILVPGSDFDDTIARLVTCGGTARYREPRRNFTARFGKGVCVVTADGLEIDVHRVFVAGPFGLAIEPADLFAEPDSIVLGDRTVPVPGARVRFLHACYHVALTSPRLSAARDVAQMVWAPDLDMPGVLALAARWRGRAVVQAAITMTAKRLGVLLPHAWDEWVRAYEPDPFERAALRAYDRATRSYAQQMVTGLRAIRGTRARVTYATALLVPERAYLGERDRSYVKRWRRAIALAGGRGGA
jgi:hypothetical protein